MASKQSFRIRMKIRDGNPYVDISSSRARALKPGWRRALPVLVRVNGQPSLKPWRINLMPTGTGAFYLYLHGDVRRASRTKVGDLIVVEVEFDAAYRNGPMHPMPAWFRTPLSRNRKAASAWDALIPSRKKEILRYFSWLKSPEARAQRRAGDSRFVGTRGQVHGPSMEQGGLRMDSRIAPLAEILRLNTVLFRNCLDGLSDEQAATRPTNATNSAAFIAAHLASSRFFLLKALGVEHPDPLGAYLDGRKGIDEIAQLPPLREIDAAWSKGAHLLRDRLDALTAADVDAPSSLKFPLANGTLMGTLTFLVQHDSYHLGQLSLLRKYCGLPAMRYQ